MPSEVITVTNTPVKSTPRVRSDSEIARQLQAELDSNPNFDFSTFQGAKPDVKPLEINFDGLLRNLRNDPPAVRERSDSEVARELQEQFNNEDNMVVNFDDQPPPLLPVTPRAPAAPIRPIAAGINASSFCDLTADTKPSMHRSDSIAGESDPCFTLYHFNGLRSGRLTSITLHRRFVIYHVLIYALCDLILYLCGLD
jgi:hypothetical protein